MNHDGYIIPFSNIAMFHISIMGQGPYDSRGKDPGRLVAFEALRHQNTALASAAAGKSTLGLETLPKATHGGGNLHLNISHVIHTLLGTS